MAHVVVFHHVHGLTTGVAAFAGELRAHGHVVDTPDLFDGEHFDTIDAGAAHADQLGTDEVIARGRRAVAELDGPFAVLGFSLGVLPAQLLAQTDARVTAAVLCHSCVPLGPFGDRWPEEVPVQIHAMEEDPYFLDEGDMDAAVDLVGEVDDAELYLYPGDRHLFADASLPSHDEAATGVMLDRVLGLLRVLDDAG